MQDNQKNQLAPNSTISDSSGNFLIVPLLSRDYDYTASLSVKAQYCLDSNLQTYIN